MSVHRDRINQLFDQYLKQGKTPNEAATWIWVRDFPVDFATNPSLKLSYDAFLVVCKERNVY
jgi:hypothetical protein